MSFMGLMFIKRFLCVIAGVAMGISMAIAADYADEGIASHSAAATLASAEHPAATSLGTPGAVALSTPAAIGPDPGNDYVRLPGHVLAALADMKPENQAGVDTHTHASREKRLTITVVLRHDDEPGFRKYLGDVYDPRSPGYHRFLSQRTITERFGPSQATYAAITDYLHAHGLKITEKSRNRLTLSATGNILQVEQAFQTEISDFRQGDQSFYANVTDPILPVRLARHVVSIAGLSSFAKPRPAVQLACPTGNRTCVIVASGVVAGVGYLVCTFVPNTLSAAPNPILAGGGVASKIVCSTATLVWLYGLYQKLYGLYQQNLSVPFPSEAVNPLSATTSGARKRQLSASPRATASGTGQTIGLLEFDAFNQSDVSNYLALFGASSLTSNLTIVPVNGGVPTPGPGEDEVLLDIDTVMSIASGAKVRVYEAPFTGQSTSYSQLFNAMINDGVTVISNSWASCEDQVSKAEATGIDAVLQAAAAAGISVFNGAGDAGATCLDGTPNTVSVPADSPNATAVGGTSLPNGLGPEFSYLDETWWGTASSAIATGQGGFGVSQYFTQPAYQSGLSNSSMRSVPDVAARADPNNGVIICQADAGGCPTGQLYGGTSLATPEWAALTAVLNQAQGKNLGFLNPLLYPLANTDAFHSPSALGTDFAHVGLGSPNPPLLSQALRGVSAGPVDASVSTVAPLANQNVATLSATGVVSIPADGTSQGGLAVTLLDSNGNLVTGKTLSIASSSNTATVSPSSTTVNASTGVGVFEVTDTIAETVNLTVTDTTDGIILPQAALNFGVPPAASAGITANPPTVTADGSSAATITVTLKDSLNRPTPGKTISLSDGGAHAEITGPTPTVTDANGQIQFTATDQVNETVTFSAVDVTDGNLKFPGTATVTYSNSTATACDVGLVPVAASGYTITPYITGLPASPSFYFGNVNWSCSGANFPAFAPSGTALESDFVTGGVYQIGLSGGNVSSANVISNLNQTIANFVFTPDGNLYATQKATTGDFTTGDIIQVDPTTGASLRVVASNLICPSSLAVDPLSGDLFFDDECSGAGSNNASLFRVIDPAGTDTSRPTSVVTYTTLPSSPNGAIAFAPNGTIYVLAFGSPSTVEQVSATNSATVTVSQVPGITPNSGIAIGATNADGSAQSLLVDPAGVLSEVSIADPSQTTVLATVSPGVGVTGPDGCLYSAHYGTVYRLANSVGACNFTQTTPVPSLSLTPATVAPNPAQGSSQTFTATLKNIAPLAGTPVSFTVSGANSQIKLATTDANGAASITYTAAQAGVDAVIASTTATGTTATGTTAKSVALNSNTVLVTWTAGKHVTFVGLNTSPQAGTVNVPVTVTATLSDVSASPATSLAGQTMTLALGGSSCTATTTSSGAASCSLTPSTAGATTLTASFAGSTTLAAATQSVGFNVSLAPTPPPAVSIAVSPTTIAAGSTATLTWSSSNATACTASGAWSGSETTSGSLAVTPATSGSYGYTLTCTGAGGSSAATAALSATLVAVTVTAKSGGGAITWTVLLFLGLLLLARRCHLQPAAGRLRRDVAGIGIAILYAFMILPLAGSARADSTTATTDSTTSLTDGFYDGIRIGAMPVRRSASKIDEGLAARGFGDVSADSDTRAAAGTVFFGYEFLPHTAVEFAYTFREATAATLTGTIPSKGSLTPLLESTAGLIRGYGNIYAVSYAGHFEVLPRFSLEPRLGGFFWATKVSAIGFDDRIDSTHEGGGGTAGLSAAYRLWRGLELGLSVDYYRGSPSNTATLFGGTVEWRFGRSRS